MPSGTLPDASRLFRLDGRVAWVTGATGGIGRILALGLAGQGAAVVLSARDAGRCRQLCAEVASGGGRALAAPADMLDPTAVEGAATAAMRAFGALDILVHCVGGSPRQGVPTAPSAEPPRAEWERMLDLHVNSTLLASHAAARAMIARKWGRILSISSVGSVWGSHEGYNAYGKAMGAVDRLVRKLATAWAADGITVNALAPIFVRTPRVAGLLADERFYSGLVARIPLGRIAEPADLLGPALLLCSDAGAFVTGQVLCVDGGLTASR